MRAVNVFLLLCASPYISCAQNSVYYEPWSDNQFINCTMRFFPFINSGTRAIQAFHEVLIIYNNKICSSNPFQLSEGRRGAEVIEGTVSCAGTTQVRIQAKFEEEIAIRYFQVRCVSEFPLKLKSSVQLPFLATVESWKGREVFGSIEQVWTAQVTAEPSFRADWSTGGAHEWSLSNNYIAYSSADENVHVSIELSLKSNLSRRQSNEPVYPDFTFLCSLVVAHVVEDNEIFTWKRVEGLSIKHAYNNCEVDPVDPAEGVDINFLRKGYLYGRVSCGGLATVEMLASYPEQTRVKGFQLSCSAGFPIDVHVDKALVMTF